MFKFTINKIPHSLYPLSRRERARGEGLYYGQRVSYYDGSFSPGATFAAFAQRADAEAVVAQYGGKVLGFSEVTPDMADLHGGAAQDMGM